MPLSAADVRALLAELPEAVEQETWGHPTFRVRKRMFGAMAADGATVTVKAEAGAQEALVASDPDTFFVPAYVGQHGWVGVVLGRLDDVAELRELLEDAWRLTAPKRVVAAFDGAR